MGDLMDVDEIAAALRRDVGSVRRMIRTGRLPAVKIGGRWYIRRDVFDALTRGELVKDKEAVQPGQVKVTQ